MARDTEESITRTNMSQDTHVGTTRFVGLPDQTCVTRMVDQKEEADSGRDLCIHRALKKRYRTVNMGSWLKDSTIINKEKELREELRLERELCNSCCLQIILLNICCVLDFSTSS